MDLASLSHAVQAMQGDMLGRLEMLVNIDSGSHDGIGIDRVGDGLEAMWVALGFEALRQPVGATADVRLFVRRFGSAAGRLLLLGHLDTVWPLGWEFREDGIFAYGPGVGDMKGGLVMAHAAVKALIDTGADMPGEIRMLLVPDEELGSPASRQVIEAEARMADRVLVVEPARPCGSVIVGRGAVGALVVEAEGIAAHVLNRDDGASAIYELAFRVEALEALTRPEQGVSVSVGILRGGDARQVVPRRCEMHIDLRAPTDAAAAALLAEVHFVLAPRAGTRVGITVSGGITRPAFPPSASAAIYEQAAGLAAALGIAYGGIVTMGGSDGSFCAALGRQTLDGLGPVCLDTCSRKERILIRSMMERTTLLAALVAGIGSATRWA